MKKSIRILFIHLVRQPIAGWPGVGHPFVWMPLLGLYPCCGYGAQHRQIKPARLTDPGLTPLLQPAIIDETPGFAYVQACFYWPWLRNNLLHTALIKNAVKPD